MRHCPKCGQDKDEGDFYKHQPYCKPCWKTYQGPRAREWYRKNTSRAKDARLKRRFGISLAEFDDLFKKQDGKCGICRRKMTDPQVDHDHTTKKVRGLLCKPCNVGLGHFNEDVQALQNAIEYLHDHRP